jgi:hypothetical protein
MHDKLPEIYWFCFWIFVVLISLGSAYMGGRGGFIVNMRKLDILKMYAEKGAEPPPAVLEHLATEPLQKPVKRDPRATHLQAFIGFLFMACTSWGLHAWLEGRGGPAWAVIATAAALAFFAIGAFGFLLAALITRQPK